MPGMYLPAVAAPSRARCLAAMEIDALLQKRSVAAAEVPGVVAMAATSQSVIYQGAFGARWQRRCAEAVG